MYEFERIVFKAIKDLERSKQVIDLTTVNNRLKETDKLENWGYERLLTEELKDSEDVFLQVKNIIRDEEWLITSSVKDIERTNEMFEETKKKLPADIAICAAAVSDFKIANFY